MAVMVAPADETQLAALIDPWLEHMRWRGDWASWRRKRIESERHQGELLGLVRVLVGPLAGRRLFDLGCGMGGFAVAAELEGADVTALDYNAAYCAITAVRAERYGISMPVLRGAAEALPLPDAAFELLTAWDVLEHVQRPPAMLGELARVLVPGGTAFVTAINRFAFRDPHYHLPLVNYLPRPLGELIVELLGRSKRRSAFRDRQRLSEMWYYTLPAFRKLASAHGFRTIDLDEQRVRSGGIAPRRRRLRPVLQTLERLGLALPLYRLYRAVYQGTYRLALVKDGPHG